MPDPLTCPHGHRWEPDAAPARHPDLCPVCGAAADDAGTVRLGPGRNPPVDHDSVTLAPPRQPPPVASAFAGSIPDYEILGELGRGGMGVVYKARQLRLKRMVALKMVLAGSHAGPAEFDRFRIEAEAVARLQHPNVVQVYEVGAHEGHPFLALEFVGGGTLAQKLAGMPLPPREAAHLLETLARAVHFAHEHGVVHRDLKPANVLLTPAGVPKVADFGLAKQLGEEGPTQTDAVLGTPSYMAPEQTRGKATDVGPATDVYALGAILYELLTGRPPFRGGSKLDTLDLVRTQEPIPPSRLQAGVPRDLETICLKCLQKEPRHRYATALALVEDLQRFQSGESIQARAAGAAERGWRWARRHPAWACLLGVVGLVVVVSFPGVTVLWLEAVRRAGAEAEARADAQEQTRQADELRRQAERRETRLALDRGLGLCEQGDAARGLLWLARCLELAEQSGEPELAHAVRVNLADWAGQLSVPGRRFSAPQEVQAVAFSPDGGRVLLGVGAAGAQQWDVATGKPVGKVVATIPHVFPRRIWSVAYSPDGRLALVGRADGSARLWDLETGAPVGPPLVSGGNDAWAVAFGPDGNLLLTGGSSARLWDRSSGRLAGQLDGHRDTVSAVAFSPDGTTAVTGSWDRTARLWDVARRQALLPPLAHEDKVMVVAFSPDGTAVATGARDGSARLWSATTGKALGEAVQHLADVTALAFNPDGRTLLTGSKDGTARLWDAATGTPVGPALPHEGSVEGVAFSPDGRACVVAGLDGSARLWRLPRQKALGRPLPHASAVATVAFSPDGTRLLTGSGDAAHVWDAARGQALARCYTGTRMRAVAVAPDGARVATADWRKDVFLWDVSSIGDRELQPLPFPFPLDPPAELAVFTPDGTRLLTVGERTEGEVRAWDVAERRPLETPLRHPAGVTCLAVSPDGRLVAAGCRDRAVYLWDLGTGQQARAPLAHPDAVKAVAFGPDATTLATGCTDGTVRLWDVAEGRSRVAAPHHRGPVLALAFGPGGSTLLTGSGDRTARVWDVATGAPLGPPLWHRDAVQAVAFAPDGKALLTGSRDRTAQLWEAPAAPVAGTGEQVWLWVRALTGMELDDDGTPRRLDEDAVQRLRQALQTPEHAEFVKGVRMP